MTADYSIAEVVRSLEKLEATMKSGFDEVKQDIQRLEDNYVTRSEFDLYKESNDRELKTMKGTLDKATEAPPKTPGWQVAGVIISAAVGSGSLLGVAILLIQSLSR